MPACLALAVLLAAAAHAQPVPNPGAQATAYVGGWWWDGARFAPRDTTWADRGVFVAGPLPGAVPGGVVGDARVVDLGRQWVVPPFGDAHQHLFDSEYSAGAADTLFMDRGVFYALVITNSARGAAGVRGRFEGPGSLDVAYTHGGITSTGSHPGPLYEGVARNGAADRAAARDDTTAWSRQRDSYWFWDTLGHVEDEWPAFLADGPDAVKVYLTDNARCDDAPTPRDCGLRPEVLADVVRRAHGAGLRVFAHVDTNDDVARALDAGVDGFAHLPGRSSRALLDDAGRWLDSTTVARLAASGVAVIPTASLLMQGRGGTLDPTRRDTLQAQVDRQRGPLRALVAAGVPVALGADRWMETAAREAAYLVAQDVFTPAQVLRQWTETTPQVVFPGRAIGRLADGFEASFLALACDPTADWSCTRQIAHREKQGVDLGMAETAQRWRRLDVAAFAAIPASTDGPLLRGLKALADADLDGARASLQTALAAAPDSLRPFVHRRLAEVAAERFDWAEALRQRAAAGDDLSEEVLAGFARFPVAQARFDGPEATVPFDGLRAAVFVNGEPVQAVVDTGAPGTGIPRGLSERLGLRIDTTARGQSRVPSLNLTVDTYAVLVDSVTVGDVTFFNVPATVGGPETSAEGDVFLGANLFRRFAGGLRYGYADSTFTVVRDLARTGERPTFLIDGGSAPVVPVRIRRQRANAIIDTGNQRTVYLARGAFDLDGVPVSRSLSGDGWSVDLYRLPFEIPGHPDGAHEAYEADFLFTEDAAITAILGQPIWAEGALTLDFVNRRVRFEPTAPNVPTP